MANIFNFTGFNSILDFNILKSIAFITRAFGKYLEKELEKKMPDCEKIRDSLESYFNEIFNNFPKAIYCNTQTFDIAHHLMASAINDGNCSDTPEAFKIHTKINMLYAMSIMDTEAGRAIAFFLDTNAQLFHDHNYDWNEIMKLPDLEYAQGRDKDIIDILWED